MKPQSFQSICPDCGIPVPASYERRGDLVYLEKNCSKHGISRVLASEDSDAFERWIAFPSVTVPPRVYIAAAKEPLSDVEHFSKTECPLHCGPCENHLMTACCVLVNVTERCNQRCPYCFADAGDDRSHCVLHAADSEKHKRQSREAIQSDPPLSVIDGWLDRLIELGEERKFNIQISGGEPTVRDDLPEIIRMCSGKGFEYIQLNTNGRRIAESASYAKTLKAAGLSTVFLQFDGISDDVYKTLRSEPLFEIKKAAVRNCGEAGLPVTLVPTVLKSVNLSQVGAIVGFMLENISVVKGVHFQPASFFGRQSEERNTDGDFNERVTMFAVMDELERQTGGLIKKSDLAPISTGHPLCCFCAAFIKEKNGIPRPLSSGGSCCAPETDPLEIIRRDRDYVLNKWELADASSAEETMTCDCGTSSAEETNTCDCGTAMNFDEAIAMLKNNMFTVSGMAFMDETNLDAERLRRCRVQVFSPDGKLIPFCAYYSIYK